MRGGSLASAATSLLLTLLVLEAATRLLVANPRYHHGMPFLEGDARFGHRGVPHYREAVSSASGEFEFVLNADGFRGRALPRAVSDDGPLRIALLGDSFLVGRSLPEHQLMSAQLEARLGERDRDAEVFNLATVDYGTGQELMLLERWAPGLRPGVVVLALYPGNDLANDAISLAGRTRVSPGDAIRPYIVPDGDRLHTRYAMPVRGFARAHSRLFAALENRVASAFGGWEIAPQGAGPAARLRRATAPYEHLELFRRHDPGHRWERAWRNSESLLRALRDRCDALGARLLVLVIPMEEQVLRTAGAIEMEIAARRHAGRPLAEILDWNLPERRFAAFFRAEQIDAHLLLGDLRAAAADAADVYTLDAHLGATGHRIASERIASWVAGEPADPPALDGAPTRRLPEAAEANPWLDFARDAHRDHLGGGWITWRPRGEDEPWGWRTASKAAIALPAAEGDLVLRGWLPAEANLPVTLRIRGVGTHTVRVSEAGTFSVRVPAETAVRSAEGYVVVRWEAVEADRRAGAPTGLVVQGIGFEATR